MAVKKGISRDFAALVEAIQRVDVYCSSQARQAVNLSLTVRNWLIGAHIAEFELHGQDRAVYGEKLLAELAEQLTKHDVSNSNRRQLYRYLRFYRLFPTIVGTLSPQLQAMFPVGRVGRKKVGTLSPLLEFPPEILVQKLSYSHLEQLVDLESDLKRTFYTVECIHGGWSVRELRRQINSLYYERSGLSKNKKKLSDLTQTKAEKAEPRLAIRDPYVFEFLGIKPREVMGESDLEDSLLDKLQEFLLELGHGFCFEARQKRILIGDTLGFIDLVFYHRILKCHVLIELKTTRFTHEHIGQLNTYVTWYRKNIMAESDNPPIGLLLCAQKDHALAEYALAGMANKLFVSKYQLELPKKEEIQRFIEQQVLEVAHGGK